MVETHQQIKDRLFRTASAIWGHKGAQTESSFDPLVGILLGACATGLEKISHDIEETRGRTLERLVQLLYPEVLANAIPAHAVAYAYPSEQKLLLQGDAQFYYQKRFAGAGEGAPAQWKNMYFTATGDFMLHQASIKIMATSRSLYAVHEADHKELLATNTSSGRQPVHQHAVWLGIENIERLSNNTSFYFELRNEAIKPIFYDYLPSAKWWVQDSILPTIRHYGKNMPAADRPDPSEIVSGKTKIISSIIKHINKTYAGCFITTNGSIGHTAGQAWPAELRQLFPEAAAQQEGKNKLGWIRIDFPENVNIDRLQDDLFICLNCFPVVNRHLIVAQQKLMEHVNIIPLASEELFLDITDITDLEGKSLDGFSKNGQDTLINLHYGGVARFNEKNALATVEGLMQQLRDESAAYSNIGNDFLNTELKALQQSLHKLDQQLAERDLIKGETPYLVAGGKDKIGTSNIFVKYWTTNGQDANGIKPGTPLALYKNADVQSNSVRLVTGTAGGRNNLSSAEKVLAYKTAILSKEKLVTAEDIASFCRLRLAMTAAAVDVQKGFMVQEKNKGGFLKTIDVNILINEFEKRKLLASGGIAFWENDLVFAINERSGFFMPVRVFIKEKTGQ